MTDAGRTDFEIEVELRSEHQTINGALEALVAALPGFGVAYFPASTPKYQRFLEASTAAPGG
jgi:hypothetical protein